MIGSLLATDEARGEWEEKVHGINAFGRSSGHHSRAVLRIRIFGPCLRHAAETIATGLIGAANAVGWPWYIGLKRASSPSKALRSTLFTYRPPRGWCSSFRRALSISSAMSALSSRSMLSRRARRSGLLRIIGQVSAYEMLAKPASRQSRISKARPSASAALATSTASISTASCRPTALKTATTI